VQVEEALSRGGRGGVAFLVVAEDAEPATATAFEARARAAGTPVVRFGTKEELGRAIGKELRAVVGVADPGLAARIQDDLAKLRQLTGNR
jgi:ribosomal protein L7Ae-like RNA K-turn-binding protein